MTATSNVRRLHGTSAASKPMQKGQQTKAAIVEAALGLATQIGLEGLSIGALAEVMQMSKSGVFAHFGSREELQISVVREYHSRFEQEVFFTALQAERGLPRVRMHFVRHADLHRRFKEEVAELVEAAPRGQRELIDWWPRHPAVEVSSLLR